MATVVYKNLRLLDPSQNWDGPAWIFVESGLVTKLLDESEGQRYFEQTLKSRKDSGHTVVDLKGACVAPGLVDVHVHLREPGFEYKETIATGTEAAVAGGFTTVLCMANTNPINDNPYVTKYILSQAAAHARCRVLPIGAVTKGLKGEELAEIGKMKEAGIVAASDDGMPIMNTYIMRKALDYCKAFDLPIIVHAEDAHLVGQGVMHEGFHSCCLGLRGIPSESEEIMVARDVALARLTGGRVHFAHISATQSLVHIQRAKEQGLRVTAEVTPHHLTFCDEDVSSYDSNFKMAPPLRSRQDVLAMRQALKDGVIDCIATDHAPHAPRDKDVLFEYAANGVVGLETALAVGLQLVDDGVLDLLAMVRVLATAPAEAFQLKAGSLKSGMPADFIVFDPNAERRLSSDALHSKSKNTPFLGRSLRGKVLMTMVSGESRWQQ
jgi:dihydroorotase